MRKLRNAGELSLSLHFFLKNQWKLVRKIVMDMFLVRNLCNGPLITIFECLKEQRIFYVKMKSFDQTQNQVFKCLYSKFFYPQKSIKLFFLWMKMCHMKGNRDKNLAKSTFFQWLFSARKNTQKFIQITHINLDY